MTWSIVRMPNHLSVLCFIMVRQLARVRSFQFDHATCITALPIFEYKRWPYLSDADFAGVLQSSVIASSGADCSPSAGGGQCDYKKVFVPCPGSPVTLSLDAVVPKSRPSPIQEWQDQLSTLEWFQVANWKQAVIDSLDIVLNTFRLTSLSLMPL